MAPVEHPKGTPFNGVNLFGPSEMLFAVTGFKFTGFFRLVGRLASDLSDLFS